jgi:hypothetical protein
MDQTAIDLLFEKWMVAGNRNISHVAAYVCVKENVDVALLRRLCKKNPSFSYGAFDRAVEAIKAGRKPGARGRRPLLTEEEDEIFLNTLKAISEKGEKIPLAAVANIVYFLLF